MRWMLHCVLVAVLSASGCAKKQAASPVSNAAGSPASPPTTSSVSPSSAAAPANSQPRIASPESTASPATPPIRDLAARYLESDGRGGWRTNVQVATDL